MAISATDPQIRTDWALVYAAMFAGVTIALQMGKAAATLPLIRAEFGADLTLLATYVSLISIMAASVGIFFGTVTRRFGARRAGLLGLGLVIIGSATGASAVGVSALLISRVIEAVGFALTVTAMPALIQPATRPRDRMVALGLWAVWLPGGVALSMALSHFFLDAIGWRGMFRLTALLPALAAVILWGVTRNRGNPAAALAPAPIFRVFRRDVLLTTGIFVAFSSSNLIEMAYLPTFLVDQFTMVATRAAGISFAGAIALIAANILGGWLLHHGFGLRGLYLMSFAGMMITAVVLFAPEFGLIPSIAASIVFSFAAGVLAATVWASIPLLAHDPSEVPVLSGLLFQGAGLGQLIGPVLAGFVVDKGGDWSLSIWVIAALISIGVVLVFGLSKELTTSTGNA